MKRSVRLENVTLKVKFLLYFYLKFDKIFQIFTEFLLKFDFKNQISRPGPSQLLFAAPKIWKNLSNFQRAAPIPTQLPYIWKFAAPAQLPKFDGGRRSSVAAPMVAAPGNLTFYCKFQAGTTRTYVRLVKLN